MLPKTLNNISPQGTLNILWDLPLEVNEPPLNL